MADGFPAPHCHHHPDLKAVGAGKLAVHELGLGPVPDVHPDRPLAGRQAHLVLDKECAVALAVAAAVSLADAAAVRHKPDAAPSAG